MLFAPAPRIVQLDLRVIADRGKELLTEKSAVEGKFRRLITVAKPCRCMPDGEAQRQHLADLQRPLERIDRVQIARRSAHQMEGPVELHLRYGFVLVGNMDFGDGVVALVLQREAAAAGEGALRRIDIDDRVDGGDLRLIELFVLFELPFVVGQLGPFLDPAKYPFLDTVRAAIKHIPADLPHAAYADSAELEDKGDKLHFNADSQKIFGARYAKAMQQAAKGWSASTN